MSRLVYYELVSMVIVVLYSDNSSNVIMKIKRFFRALLTALPTIGSSLEQIIFGSQNDNEIERIKNIKRRYSIRVNSRQRR